MNCAIYGGMEREGDMDKKDLILKSLVNEAKQLERLQTGQQLESPCGGMLVKVVGRCQDDILATTDGKVYLDGWCTCRANRQGYFEWLVSGNHGWYCLECGHITQMG